MVRKKLALLTAALLSAALLWGCGSSGSGGMDVQPIDPADVQTVGIFNCSTCHGNGPQAQAWLESKHAAGSYGGTGAVCLNCHDPGRDGQEMAQAFGVTNRNVVGCESCHGGGSAHRGLGPLPFPRPGVETCGQCHGDLTVAAAGTHIGNNPFTNLITDRFLDSRHAGTGVGTPVRANTCAACHSHEGAVLYLSAIEASGNRNMMLRGGVLGLENALAALGTVDTLNVKTCTTCHDAHSGKVRGLGDITQTFAGAGAPAERVVFSAEFNLCTSCHQVNLAFEFDEDAGYAGRGMIRYFLADAHSTETRTDALNALVDWHNVSQTNAGRTIVDTHFAGAARIPVTGALREIAGYNINPGSPNACSSCHDVHSASKFGANSGASFDMAVSFAEGFGQNHGNYISDAFSREQFGCTPCHTGRDFVKLTEGRTLAQLGSPRWNTLGCVSCHDMLNTMDPASGTPARVVSDEPRTFPANHVFQFQSGAVVDVADLGRSQVCFECHKGRTGFNDTATITTVYGVNYLHYSPSAAILFGDESEMVPTYEGQLYAGLRNVHVDFNQTAVLGCADCHEVHSGGIRANNPVVFSGAACVSCHLGNQDTFDVFHRDRTKAFGDRLKNTILDVLEGMFDGGDFNLPEGLTAAQQTRAMKDLIVIFEGIDSPLLTGDLALSTSGVFVSGMTERAAFVAAFPNDAVKTPADRLKIFITGSPRDATGSRLVTNALAKAGAAWKNFNYDDKAAWAHNSVFARQVMFDAIQDLGGSTTGLVRPN